MPSKGTKAITVRVSEEDFEALNQISGQTEKHSIGDLAREEMFHLVNTAQAKTLTGADARLWFKELVSRLTSLQAEIERLEELLKVQR
jgi:hypothetical protein